MTNNFIHCHNTQCINFVNMRTYHTFHVINVYYNPACNICKLQAPYWVFQTNKRLMETIIKVGSGNRRGWRGIETHLQFI